MKTLKIAKMEQKFDKIVCNPDILGGKPCIVGTRISVEIILEWIASGATISDIADRNKHIPEGAIVQAIMYASKFLKNEIIIEVNHAA
jgi:uncharacterized protein (DUF433 family)